MLAAVAEVACDGWQARPKSVQTVRDIARWHDPFRAWAAAAACGGAGHPQAGPRLAADGETAAHVPHPKRHARMHGATAAVPGWGRPLAARHRAVAGLAPDAQARRHEL